MNRDTFIQIAKQEKPISEVETAELKAVIDKYPYFQTARALYLKGLKQQDSFKYNNALKQTAAYTTDRTILFDYITSADFLNQKETIHKQIVSEMTEEKNDLKVVEAEKNLKIGTPISFNKRETHSFNQWLQLSNTSQISRADATIKKNSSKEDLIDKFIENNPKIEPLPKGKNIALRISENKQDDALMTETLAKVYLEQKKFDNAIQAYRILSLKYPEKSGFFADQIKRIQILQKHKS